MQFYAQERVQARGFLGRLILHLEKEGFLTDHLTVSPPPPPFPTLFHSCVTYTPFTISYLDVDTFHRTRLTTSLTPISAFVGWETATCTVAWILR